MSAPGFFLDGRYTYALDPRSCSANAPHLIREAGLTRASAVTGAVPLIQRFVSALNLNVHFHLLVLDGVYRRDGGDRLRFTPVPAPGTEELDIDNAYLAFDPGEQAPSDGLLGSSITCRIATGPGEGQKVFTLQLAPTAAMPI